MIASLTALLLQVNAAALPQHGGPQKMDACSFAKSADMSADSRICAKEAAVDASGYKSRPRVTPVDAKKRSRRSMELSVVDKTLPQAPTAEEIESAKKERTFEQFMEVMGGSSLLVGGGIALVAGIGSVAIGAGLIIGGAAIMVDGTLRARTGRGLAERLYDGFTR
jgi:hypothetical protein